MESQEAKVPLRIQRLPGLVLSSSLPRWEDERAKASLAFSVVTTSSSVSILG